MFRYDPIIAIVTRVPVGNSTLKVEKQVYRMNSTVLYLKTALMMYVEYGVRYRWIRRMLLHMNKGKQC